MTKWSLAMSPCAVRLSSRAQSTNRALGVWALIHKRQDAFIIARCRLLSSCEFDSLICRTTKQNEHLLQNS
jgi:hypothetical protein